MSAELQPGPELDRMVAEKVMGWRKAEGTIIWKWVGRDGTHRGAKWSPSTSWEDVEEAVDRLERTGWAVMVGTEMPTQGTREWRAVVAPIGMRGPDWVEGVAAVGMTMPHALCLAALGSLGFSTEDTP